MKKNRDEKIGEWAAIGHMVLDGFWPVAANYGVRFLPPVELLGIVTFISGFFFLWLTLKKGQLRQLFKRKTLLGCVLYTFCLLFPYILIFYATKSTSAINTALFTQSEVIFAAVVGYVLMREKVQMSRWIGVLCVFVANLVVLYNGSLHVNGADVVLMVAPLVFVFGNAWAKKLQADGLGYAPLLLFRGLAGGTFLLVLSPLLGDFHVPAASLWPFLFITGFFAFGLPKMLWQIALNKIDLSKTTAIGLSYPAFSFLAAFVWLGEVPSVYQWSGLLITFLGIWFLMRSTSQKLNELGAPSE